MNIKIGIIFFNYNIIKKTVFQNYYYVLILDLICFNIYWLVFLVFIN